MAECTIYDKLRYISETKDLIKMAIESQDVEVLESATFRQYAEYITEIRKVSSVNGMQGDVVITLEDLGGLTLDALNGYATEQWVEDKKYLTEHQSLEDYYTKNDIDSKGYITAIPETYITEDELSNELKDKVSETALNEALKGYYDKGEVDNLIDNVDVTEQLQNYYTKEEIEGKKYLTEVPSEYITEEELADTLDIITEMGEDITSLEENKQDKLTQGTGIKIENNVISLDYSYDLFEVVTELPTENINENKIYLLQDPTASNKEVIVEGHMTPSTDYNWEGRDTYIQDGEATIDGTTINNDKRTRVTLRGFEGDTTIMLGLSFAPMDIIAEQLYIQLQLLNEDTSEGKPDTWRFRDSGQVGEGVSWTTIGLGTLDPTQEYFFDVWTNGGQASVGGTDFYLPSYIAIPQSEKSGSLFIEYIYNNGEWEELGKNIKMVDPKAYCSIGVDPNGFNGKSYAIFSRADGSGDVLEVAKINGKTMIGREAKELSLAETKEVTQAEYDSMSKEDGVIYVITDAEEIGIPTKLSQLENDMGFITDGESGGGINESELHHVLHTYKYPYINEVEVDPSLNNVKFLSIEYINENGQYKTTNETVKFKTINGNHILGEGDITIQSGDMTNYYSKEEIDALIGGVETKITELNDMI